MEKRGYQAFCKFVSEKKIALIGLGVSNMPLIPFLFESGAKSVAVRDLKLNPNSDRAKEAVSSGASLHCGEGYLENLTEDIIIRSPGIRPDIPPFLSAQEKGALITCETELFLRFTPAKSVCITGSDGKTTTTTIIAKLLELSGFHVLLGGNIGKAMLPRLPEAENERAISVTELSSFQLMGCRFSPDIALITNLSENHLDWHKDMSEYLEAKKNILRFQKSSGIAVLNFDNSHTKSCTAAGKTLYFSKSPLSCDGVYLKDGIICSKRDGVETEILPIEKILLPGMHNVENYMAAIAAVGHLVTKENIVHLAKTFGGVEHRIEFIRELDGVRYFNSSIDSSPARSTAALRAFEEKLIMIAGGYDKNLDYTSLGEVICERVKILILCGKTAEKIENAVVNAPNYQNNHPQIIHAEDFSDTVRLAREVALRGDTVILSPASASFDRFKNFEERGRLFKKLVMELK